MTKATKKPAPPKAGHNSRRALDVIAGEIHHLERNNIFAIGKLLAEAEEGTPGEYGEWMDWLDQFNWSYDTSDNYLRAYKLALKFGTVRNLKVQVTIIYDLAHDHLTWDNDGNHILRDGELLKATVQDLDKAAKSAEKPLRVADCNRIITDHLRSHLEKFFGVVLPEWLDKKMLDRLPRDADLFQKVAAKLKAESPLTLRQIRNLIERLKRGDKGDEPGDQQGADDEPDKPEPDKPEPDKPNASELEAIKADRKFARDLIKQNRSVAQWLCVILTNQKRRDAVADALIRALKNSASKAADGNDTDATESAEAMKKTFSAEEPAEIGAK